MKFKLISIVTLFCILLCNFAQAKDLPPQVFHLKSGQTVVIKELHSNPIVTVDTWVNTGSKNENPQNNGVSHFLEHLMFKGTKNYKTGEIDRILEGKGGKFNAATSKDYTHFYVTIPSQNLDTALKLNAELIINANFPVDEVNKERGVVIEEINRANSSPESILYDNLMAMLFSNHPYGRNTLGPAKNIAEIPRAKILEYHDKYYIPSNMTTVVVGDVDTKAVLGLIEKYYSSPNNTRMKANVYAPQKPLAKDKEQIKYGDYAFGYLFMGYKGVPLSDIKENFALDMAASIIGVGESSRLYQELKETQKIVSSINAGHHSLKDDSVFYIAADFEGKNYKKVVSSIKNVIAGMALEGITDEELEKAKTQAKRSIEYSRQSTEGISDELGYYAEVVGNIDMYNDAKANIDSITAKDVQNVIKKYIYGSHYAISAILPKDTRFEPVENTPPTTKNTEILTPKPFLKTLPNGIQLIENKNNDNEIISMSVFFRGGKLLDKPAGVMNLIESTLLKGTNTKSALEIAKQIESMGISIAPSLDSDYFEINFTATKSDFDRGFCILIDILNNADFPQSELDKSKKDILDDILKTRDRPMSKAFEAYAETMYKNRPYGNVGHVIEKSIPDITRNQVLKTYKKVFVPQNMVVAISGDFNGDEIASKFTKSFPDKSSAKPKIEFSGKIKDFKEDKIITQNSDTPAAWLVLGWQTSGLLNEKDYVTLKVIDSILSSGLSSRMYKTFREKQALCYAVGSSYSDKTDNSSFALFIGTSPINVDLVKQKLLEEMDLLKTQTVSEEELCAAKQKLISEILLSQETNAEKSHVLGVFQTIDKGYGFTYDFPELINKVSAQDIKAVAEKYFSKPYVLSVTAPQKK